MHNSRIQANMAQQQQQQQQQQQNNNNKTTTTTKKNKKKHNTLFYVTHLRRQSTLHGFQVWGRCSGRGGRPASLHNLPRGMLCMGRPSWDDHHTRGQQTNY